MSLVSSFAVGFVHNVLVANDDEGLVGVRIRRGELLPYSVELGLAVLGALNERVIAIEIS